MKLSGIALAMLVALLSGCGGGGSDSGSVGGSLASSSSSGSVTGGILGADGSAMAFGRVSINSLVDASSSTGTADRNGALAIPTSGVTFPAIVKIQSLNGSKTNYGYIANGSQATVPVTPLTTLILAIASGGNPANITSSTQLSASRIDTAKAAVNAIFYSVFRAFSVNSSADLLATGFATDHTGLDLLLDAITIKFDAAGSPTICTKILNSCKTLNLSSLDTTALAITDAEVAALTSAPIGSCSAVINNLTSSAITTGTSLYATTFLNSGLDAAGYRQAMVSTLGGLSASFMNPIFIGKDDNNNYLFQFDYLNTSTNQYAGSLVIPFNIVGASCVMVGDQLPFMIQANSSVTAQYRVDGTGNNSATTTAAPVAGFSFKAGGDGFGGTTVQNTVTVSGQPVTIQTIRFYFCDANRVCSRQLMEMVKGASNNGYYYTPGGVNTLPLLSYTAAGINSASDFYNGNPNPIKVDMLDAGGTIRKTAYLKIRGGFIPANFLSAVTLPSVSNAQAVLAAQSTIANPTLNITIPNGTAVQRVWLTSFAMSNNGQPLTNQKFVLSSSSTTMQMSLTINSTDDYRSIQLGGSTSDGTPISIKYVWALNCTGCS